MRARHWSIVLHGFHRGRNDAAVAHHVRVGEVQDRDVGAQVTTELLASRASVTRISRHLRLQVVGRDLGARNQHATFPGILLLLATREEERHVRVLLGLCDAQLPHAGLLTDHLREECPRGSAARTPPGTAGPRGIASSSRSARSAPRCAGSPVKSATDERVGELPGTIRTVVEEDHGIAGAHAAAVRRADHRRQHELVASRRAHRPPQSPPARNRRRHGPVPIVTSAS